MAHIEVKGSISRAARVLDILASAPEGAALAEVVAQSNFTKTTTFRVLASLQEVDYVSQNPVSRQYRLGHKLAGLARSAVRADISALAERSMKRLTEMSEDTVFLSIPEGAAAVCVARNVGAFPIRTLTLDKGDRRPLGVGAGSLALYCAMSDSQRSAACRVNRNWLAEYEFSEGILEEEYAAYLKNGYAANKGRIVPGMSAISVPVMTAKGQLSAAIAIGAIDERMEKKRIDKVLIPAMKREAKNLAARLSEFEKEQIE